MSSQPNRPLRIELIVSASRPELLEGLDVWLRLGLLSDSQVKRISQTYLSCPLPEVVVTPTLPIRQSPPPQKIETPIPSRSLSPLSGIWQSFQDEFSVRWLLFLGVFLVVVSSGVLAATQWRNFPPAGQYGVLWGYTIIFWGIGIWARNKQNLKLTSQTLELVALLLVPVNFWAMDSFGLWRYFWEWIVVIVAAFSLTGIILFNQAIRDDSSRFTSRTSLMLCLGYLHWGWHFSEMPLLAVYLGVIGTTIFLPKSRSSQRGGDLGEREMGRGGGGELFNTTRHSNGNVSGSPYSILPNAPTGSSVVIYALVVLLSRGIFIVGLPIQELGLAIAICGWLLARLGKPPETESASSFGSQVWDGIGGGLLLVGWLVCIEESFPFQATMVSGLALSFFAQRLQYFRLRRDLAAIFLIGLQSLFLLWRLIPSQLQQSAIALFTQFTDSSSDALLSLALFPYIMSWVGLTDWLYRTEKNKLARFGEWLTLFLGVTLTAISTISPTTQSLNLLLSTITLGIVASRRLPLRVSLVYLTHITGLLTIFSIINEWFPNLSQVGWARILLILMVGEWSLSTMGCFWRAKPSQIIQNTDKNTPQSPSPVRGKRQEVTRKTPHSPLPTPKNSIPESCWYIGFILAGISYMLLWNETFTSNFLIPTTPQQFGLLWLLTPLTLTGVASRTNQSRRKEASWWSIIALIIVQCITLPFSGVRLIGLGIATVVMWFNTRYLKELAAASINIGFGLSYAAMLLWAGIPGLAKLSGGDWLLAGAIAIIALWLLQKWLIQGHGTLAALYAQASDNWAIAISGLELFLLILHSCLGYQDIVSGSWQYPAASILIGLAILFRYWQEQTESGLYGINLAIELAVAEGILLANGSSLSLAIANIILGLVILLWTDWLLKRESLSSRLIIHSQGLPLFYATLGIPLRLYYFTPYTGFLTLGAALTFVAVGCRYTENRSISYLGIAGISIAWYELAIYQMLQTPGGSPADGLTILAGLAAAIAIIYRLFAWLRQLSHHSHLLNFTIAEITNIAHIHWVIGSALIFLAATTSLGTIPKLRTFGVGISFVLALYAIIQGRYPKPRNKTNLPQNPPSSSAHDFWVYLGLIEVAVTGIYTRLTWTQLGILDPWRVIVSCGFAIFLYQIPWWRGGWNIIPWQRYAIVSPLLTVLTIWLKGDVISDLNLFAIASFYGWIAKCQVNLRWTYFSLFFLDWAIARSFDRLELIDPLWNAMLIGLSILYIAQIDPELQIPPQRQTRHYLYLLGTGIICLVALLYHQDTGVIPAIISIIAIFAGLGLRVRAFLFVGTATFLLTAFYQLVVLSFRYPFSKWVIGLIVGILFISIAANFERRREQIISILQNWVSQLSRWA